MSPLDPTHLGRLPTGHYADGNAYRIELHYEPSSQPVTTLANPGNLVLTVPQASQTLFFSTDGRQWRSVEHQCRAPA
jgi:hypothetical protein